MTRRLFRKITSTTSGILPVCLAWIFAAGCGTVSQSVVTLPVSEADTLGSHGVVYCLPRTVIHVSVSLERTTVVPGPYHAYAEQFLGIENVPHREQTEWSMAGIDVCTTSEPDPDRFYLVTSEEGGVSEAMLAPYLSKGIMLPGPASSREKHAGNIMPGGSLARGTVFTDLSVKKNHVERMDTLYKTILTDSSFIRVPVFVKKIEDKTLEEKAREAAAFIIKIRKRRFRLITGMDEFYPEAGALRTGVDELDELEQVYTSLFTGRRFQDTVRLDYRYVPGEGGGDYENIRLFEFSRDEGFDARPGSGELVSLMIRKAGITRGLANYSAGLKPGTPGVLYYRIPDMADLEVQHDGIALFRDRIEVEQYGKIASIPLTGN